jgi:tetratricopeptide (TPR) repeat protein
MRERRHLHESSISRSPKLALSPGVLILPAPLHPVRGREFQLLTEAHRARNKGRNRLAIRLYRRILTENPNNFEVALRVAPMLAVAGEDFEAWQLYRRVAREYAREKQFTECLAVYREACRFVPYEFDAWRLCAELQLKMNRPEGAFETLIDGRMHFGGPNTRAQAIALLTRARSIEAWDDDLLLDLAQLYAGNDQRDMALELLGMLACRVNGRALRRVRYLQWKITLSFRFLFLWVRTLGAHDTRLSAANFEPLPAEDEEAARPRLLRVGS